jgi:hypothetical protein
VNAIWGELKAYLDRYDQDAKGFLIEAELRNFFFDVWKDTTEIELNNFFRNMSRVA